MRSSSVKFGLLAMFLLTGCQDGRSATNGREPGTREHAVRGIGANQTPAQREAGDSAAARVEQGQKLLDRGGEAQNAKAKFESVLSDKSASQDVQDEARLGLSEAREKLGDKDGALSALEDLLASHAADGSHTVRENAERRLRRLLTGTEKTGQEFTPPETYAPVARLLTSYFKPDEKGATLFDTYVFGGANVGGNDPLGIFNFAGAKRDLVRENCVLCDEKLDMGSSRSRSRSWTSIPTAMGEAGPEMPQIDRSLLIFYFDLGDDKVPSRYDEYLPIPSAEIVQHLEQGEGLIAMRERKDGKPTIVIAAPRVGQLGTVEEAFSKLTTFQKTPLVVEVTRGLSKEEIQSTVRASMGSQRKCYDALLARDPQATGKVVASFVIEPDATITNVAIDESLTTLKDEAMQKCSLDVYSHLVFPRTGQRQTVTYPLAFSPG